MPNWEPLGTHRYYCAADLMFLEIHGDFTLPDTEQLFTLVDLITRAHGYVLLGFDARDSGVLPVEARKYVSERTRGPLMEGGTAIVGASFAVRTSIQLLRTAGRLFGIRAPPLQFFGANDEALRWLAGQRQRCQAARPAS